MIKIDQIRALLGVEKGNREYKDPGKLLTVKNLSTQAMLSKKPLDSRLAY